jgi:hypothetical protein
MGLPEFTAVAQQRLDKLLIQPLLVNAVPAAGARPLLAD